MSLCLLSSQGTRIEVAVACRVICPKTSAMIPYLVYGGYLLVPKCSHLSIVWSFHVAWHVYLDSTWCQLEPVLAIPSILHEVRHVHGSCTRSPLDGRMLYDRGFTYASWTNRRDFNLSSAPSVAVDVPFINGRMLHHRGSIYASWTYRVGFILRLDVFVGVSYMHGDLGDRKSVV